MPERAFNGLLAFLKSKYRNLSQAQITSKLYLKQWQVSSYQNKGPERVSWWREIARKIYELGYGDGRRQTSRRMMEAIVDYPI